MSLHSETRNGGRKPQQITRIPPFRPGDWVKLWDLPRATADDLSGKVRRVKSLTSAITSRDQKVALWRVHFEDGRFVEACRVERLATELEIDATLRRAR